MESKRKKRVVHFLVAGVVVGVAIAAYVLFRRPDMTDPAEIWRYKGRLRDGEMQTLLRAAFRNAKEVTIESEGHPSTRVRSRRVVISNQRVLDRLADSLALGRDRTERPKLSVSRPDIHESYV